jgi:hypothetical protein
MLSWTSGLPATSATASLVRARVTDLPGRRWYPGGQVPFEVVRQQHVFAEVIHHDLATLAVADRAACVGIDDAEGDERRGRVEHAQILVSEAYPLVDAAEDHGASVSADERHFGEDLAVVQAAGVGIHMRSGPEDAPDLLIDQLDEIIVTGDARQQRWRGDHDSDVLAAQHKCGLLNQVLGVSLSLRSLASGEEFFDPARIHIDRRT